MSMPTVYAIRLGSEPDSSWYRFSDAEATPGEVPMIEGATFMEDMGDVNWHRDRLLASGRRPEDLFVFPVTLLVYPDPLNFKSGE